MGPGLRRDDGKLARPSAGQGRLHFRASVRIRTELGLPPLDHPGGRRTMLDRRQILAALGTSALVALAPSVLCAAASIKPDDASALLVIDVQNCFLPGGSLAVKEGEQVVPVINKMAKAFANVVMTQDWHTP